MNSTFFAPISLPHPSSLVDNTQHYLDLPHFLTGTHIVMKAGLCKIASLHRQTVTHENEMVECSPNTAGLHSEQSIREKIFCPIVVSTPDFCGKSSPSLPPCFLTLWIINLTVNLIPKPQSKIDPGHIPLPSRCTRHFFLCLNTHLRPDLAHTHVPSTSISPDTQKLTHSPGRQGNAHVTIS